jgi:hypothetical protein
MELDQMLQLRTRTERSILDLVKDFENDTGLNIDSLRLDKVQSLGCRILTVRVMAEVSLP